MKLAGPLRTRAVTVASVLVTVTLLSILLFDDFVEPSDVSSSETTSAHRNAGVTEPGEGFEQDHLESTVRELAPVVEVESSEQLASKLQQATALTSASGLPIKRAFLRHSNALTELSLVASSVAHSDFSEVSLEEALLVVPGHRPVSIREVISQKQFELEPDIWLTVYHPSTAIRRVDAAQGIKEQHTALWGPVSETSWAFTMAVSGFSSLLPASGSAESVATFHLVDGGSVAVFLKLTAGRRATLSLAAAGSVVPLVVRVEPHTTTVDPVHVQFIPSDAKQAQSDRREDHDWGIVYYRSAISQEVELAPGETDAVFSVKPGVDGRIEGFGSGLIPTVGGSGEFTHDGSVRTLVLRLACVIKGRLMDELHRPLTGSIEFTWLETGGRGPWVSRRLGGPGKRPARITLSEGGDFSIPIVPRWHQEVSIDEAQVTFEAFGFEERSVLVDLRNSHIVDLGDIRMVAAFGEMLTVVTESLDQRDWIVAAAHSGVKINIIRKGSTFSSQLRGVELLEGNRLGVVVDMSGPDHVAQPSEVFDHVKSGDVGYLSILESDDEVLIQASRSGELVVVSQVAHRVKIRAKATSKGGPLVVEWHWPSPSGRVWREIARENSTMTADGRTVSFVAPAEGAWLVWRQGRSVLGQVELREGDEPVVVP